MKSFQEINDEFFTANVTVPAKRPSTDETLKNAPNRKNRGVFSFISDLMFYLAVFMILFSVFSAGNGKGVPKPIFGYSYFTVVSRSMQDEIPKGSFILVRQTRDLNVGDTITYLRDNNTTVTHKIVNIYDNYADGGVRGFQTKGNKNTYPDEGIVSEGNVIGKVIFALPVAGSVINYFKENIHLVFIIFGLCILFSFGIRGLFVKSDKTRKKGRMKIKAKEALP